MSYKIVMSIDDGGTFGATAETLPVPGEEFVIRLDSGTRIGFSPVSMTQPNESGESFFQVGSRKIKYLYERVTKCTP